MPPKSKKYLRRQQRRIQRSRNQRLTQETGKLQYIYYNTGDYSWIPYTSWFDIVANNYNVLHPVGTPPRAPR